MSAFSLLALPLRRLLEERGFREPTAPQEDSIPHLLEGRNLLLIAPTGTGKTEAALLPGLHHLLVRRGAEERGRPEPGVHILYVTPLRALNRDMEARIQWWANRLDFTVSVRHGDTAQRERKKQSMVPPSILITTPETLQILLNAPLLRQALARVRYVIVDEVHELAESKRGSQFALSMQRLAGLAGGGFQVAGLSATVGSPERVARFLFGGGEGRVVYVPVAKHLRLEVAYPEPTSEDIGLAGSLTAPPEVAARIREMARRMGEGTALLFTNTRPTAEALGARFRILDPGLPVMVHHGSLSVGTRLRAERGLRDGSLRGVVCTSSLELGIDVGSVEQVLQYGSPRQVTRLIQRVGRSGHWVGGVSRGTVVVQDGDDALESLVIARRALAEELEPIHIPEKPLDALMHEVAGMLVYRPRWDLESALELVRGADPYRDISPEEFRRVLDYMASLGLARISPGQFSRPGGRSEALFSYFYENLSMIPENKQYLVVSDQDDLPVGILDDEFVVEHGEPGVKFVMGGSVWKIVQVFGERIFVSPDPDPLGAIPSWVGEEIPVPTGVAREVGRLRGRAEALHQEGKSPGDIGRELARDYPAPPEALAMALRETLDHIRSGAPVPTDTRFLLERWGEFLILHAPLGTLANRTLARYLAQQATDRLGAPAAATEDAYRITLRTRAPLAEVARLLAPENVEEVVRGSIVKSRYYRRRFVQVARRMAAISKNTDLGQAELERTIEALRQTPVFDEAFQETITRDLDMQGAIEVLQAIRRGDIQVARHESGENPSPLAALGLKYARTEAVAPGRKRHYAIASVRARLQNEYRTLICPACRTAEETRAADITDPQCPRCRKTRGLTDEPPEDALRRLDARQERFLRELKTTQALLHTHGGAGALVLASRADPGDMEPLLARWREQSTGKGESGAPEALIELILEAERRSLLRRFSRGKPPAAGG
ncbi:MAG: DEAD/DEAH box helicase [Euryarchaeota archaeon]|nr:DEAD/DEAH box helicase [Euryarchaeota archaeon]